MADKECLRSTLALKATRGRLPTKLATSYKRFTKVMLYLRRVQQNRS